MTMEHFYPSFINVLNFCSCKPVFPAPFRKHPSKENIVCMNFQILDSHDKRFFKVASMINFLVVEPAYLVLLDVYSLCSTRRCSCRSCSRRRPRARSRTESPSGPGSSPPWLGPDTSACLQPWHR